jgi:hypothetical protein
MLQSLESETPLYLSLRDWIETHLDGAVPSKSVRYRLAAYVTEMYNSTGLELAPMVEQYDSRGYRLPDVQGYYLQHSYLIYLCYLRAVGEPPASFKNLAKQTANFAHDRSTPKSAKHQTAQKS